MATLSDAHTQAMAQVMGAATSQGINRRTNEQRASHMEAMKQLMDLGVAKAIVVQHAQRGFGISRQQAYKDYEYAEAEWLSDGNTPEEEEFNLEDRVSLSNMIMQLALDTYKEKDVNGFCRVVREYERLFRMGGIANKMKL